MAIQFVFAQMTSFMCGYHVHEKAILYAILPMTLLCCDSRGDARVYMLLSWIGHFSLLPLLFEVREQPLQPFAFRCTSSRPTSRWIRTCKARSERCGSRRPGSSSNGTSGCTCSVSSALRFYPHRAPHGIYVDGIFATMMISIYCSIGMLHVWYLIYFPVRDDCAASRRHGVVAADGRVEQNKFKTLVGPGKAW